MKLGSLKSSSRDGTLVVISKDNTKYSIATEIAPNLRTALENWSQVKFSLEELYKKLNAGKGGFQPVQEEDFLSPLPRSFQWIDGSTFIQHIKLVRKSRQVPLPETLETIPLVYQGAGDSFLSPTEDIPQESFSHGTDFEAEVAVIVDDVPMGVSAIEALNHIVLFMLVNDISLRAIALEELKRGFGFLQSKPSSSFAPFAVSSEELGENWKEGRIHLPLLVNFNGKTFGKAHAGEMHFHFGELISHCAKTRSLTAGTIIGSGTVSNEDFSKGSSCLVEKRTLEKIQTGKIKQNFMKEGDRVEIKMLDQQGQNIFGTISQKVSSLKK
ncbi:MAG: fumarylacetoacetate hydrolase family protein [Bdellovibrionales bacterium]|nr:fumarylacetoacetate hydrolase family protein [Bdellovibrionales bacterium]